MILDVAREFSSYPIGRYKGDSEFNGTKFRETLLVPRLKAAIKSNKTLVVDIDGMRSFGSSFLEESFGGLITDEGLSRALVQDHLRVKTTRPGFQAFVKMIDLFISNAQPKKKTELAMDEPA